MNKSQTAWHVLLETIASDADCNLIHNCVHALQHAIHETGERPNAGQQTDKQFDALLGFIELFTE